MFCRLQSSDGRVLLTREAVAAGCYLAIGLALASRNVAVCMVSGKRDDGRVFEKRIGSEEVQVVC